MAIDARLHDRRPPGSVDAAVYDLHHYAASQALGRRLHGAGSAGVAYRSVRHERGQCVGLFRPTGASRCLHAAYLLPMAAYAIISVFALRAGKAPVVTQSAGGPASH